MPRLEEKMKRVSEGAAEQLPDDALQVMQRHTKEMVNSGRADQAVGEGDQAPDFSLPDERGRELRLEDVRSQGPVILSFYRGRW